PEPAIPAEVTIKGKIGAGVSLPCPVGYLTAGGRYNRIGGIAGSVIIVASEGRRRHCEHTKSPGQRCGHAFFCRQRHQNSHPPYKNHRAISFPISLITESPVNNA